MCSVHCVQCMQRLQEMSLQSCWDWANFESNLRSVFHRCVTHGDQQEPLGVRSLSCLCIDKIISDSSLAGAASVSVPKSLMYPLATAAVKDARCASLAQLMERWHEPRLVLGDLHRDRINIMDLINVEVENRKQLVATGKELVQTLLARLVRQAKAGNAPPVRVLDIGGFPLTWDFLVNVLTEFSEIKSSNLRPQLTIVLDLYLTDQDCRNLNRMGHLKEGLVKVKVRHIYFSVLTYGSGLFWQEEYLESLNKLRSDWSHIFDLSCVVGLELSRVDMRSFFEGKATVCNRNSAIHFFMIVNNYFSNITALDLSYNALNLNGSITTTQVLRNFIKNLSKLKRLDISGNRLTNNLSVLLADLANLQYLNVSGTQLRASDISYLARFTNLEHLDISNCSLYNKLNVLHGVFRALTNLAILEMVDCYLQQIHFDELAPILRKMKTLQLLNINGNRVNAEYLSCKVLCDPYEDVLDEFL